MTVAQLITQLRQIVLEYPETSNMSLKIQGFGEPVELSIRSTVGEVVLEGASISQLEASNGTINQG